MQIRCRRSKGQKEGATARDRTCTCSLYAHDKSMDDMDNKWHGWWASQATRGLTTLGTAHLYTKVIDRSICNGLRLLAVTGLSPPVPLVVALALMNPVHPPGWLHSSRESLMGSIPIF